MSNIFTIQITPIKKPFMRAKKTMQQTVCKHRDGSSGYKYSPYAYGKQHCGYVYKYKDTAACIAERAQYMPAFLEMVDRVHSCLLYTSPSPRDVEESRMPSSA